VSVCLSARPSVRMHHLGFGWKFFHTAHWSVGAPLRSAERIKVVYCQTNIKPKYTYDKAPIIFFPGWRKVPDKNFRENQNTYFISDFSKKSSPMWNHYKNFSRPPKQNGSKNIRFVCQVVKIKINKEIKILTAISWIIVTTARQVLRLLAEERSPVWRVDGN